MTNDKGGGFMPALSFTDDMKRVRVFMLKTDEQRIQGEYYNLPQWEAAILISKGLAKLPSHPSEFKPRGPSEMKIVKKKNG